MDESLLHEFFGVDRTYRCTGNETRHGGVFIALEPKGELFVCPVCGSAEVIRKGKRTRRIQTLPIGFHPVFLEVEVPRCQCKVCDKIFEIAPLCPPYAPSTCTLSQFVYKLSGVMTLSDVAELTLLNWGRHTLSPAAQLRESGRRAPPTSGPSAAIKRTAPARMVFKRRTPRIVEPVGRPRHEALPA